MSGSGRFESNCEVTVRSCLYKCEHRTVLLVTSILGTDHCSRNLGLSPLLKTLTQSKFRKPKLEVNWLKIKQ